MPVEIPTEVDWRLFGGEVDEKTGTAVRRHPDRQSVHEVARGAGRLPGERDGRQFFEPKAHRPGEVLDLLALSGQPGDLTMRHEFVEDDQPLNRPGHGRWPPEPALRLVGPMTQAPPTSVDEIPAVCLEPDLAWIFSGSRFRM
jgi:hypothetical protein